jgi:protein-S-isoprenylcysteine O-methyltransferase Ste14
MAEVSPGKIALAAVRLLVPPALILLLSGDWRWPEGWLFIVWFVTLSVTCIAYLYQKDPALLAERFRRPGTGNQARWDKFLFYGLAIGFAAWIAIMPLDAKRYASPPAFPIWLKAAGGALLLLSFFFFFRAFADNTFLSPLVRIQAERGHRVVSKGVYGFVRHPMYLGALLMSFGAPLLLGSKYGLVVGALLTLILAGRIAGEERLLVRELPGYAEYRKKVRYRLIPFVW